MRRQSERFKDQARVYRAELAEDDGSRVELSIIDISTSGAALCDVRDTWKIPQVKGNGRIRIRCTSPAKRPVDVGRYAVVRHWPRGPGPDAGVAVTFTEVHEGFLSHIGTEQWHDTLRQKPI